MRLYIFGANVDCMTNAVTNADDVPVGYYGDMPRPWDFSRVYVEVNDDPEYRHPKFQLPDRLCIGGNFDFMVSSRAKELVDRVSVPRDVCVIPATVLTYRGKSVISDDYWFFCPRTRCSILNRGRSDVRCAPGTEVIVWINKWAIDEDRVPNCDLFAEEEHEWFATEYFKESWSLLGLTGARFTEVEVL